MAKGVKKIKEAGRGSVLEEFTSRPNNIICIKPNQMVTFEVSEWYDDTTAAEKENTIIWLWQDQKKTTIFHRAVKQPNTPFGVNLPKKSCGSYAYYLEASLYGAHDHRNTGLYVYGKCEEKITAASWSKKENTADTSEINYGHNLFINLETEGVNGDTLTLELYNEKNTSSAQTIKAKCIDGNILKAPFFTLGYRMFVPPPLENTEKFYLKVKDITGKYLTNASGSDKVLLISIVNKNAVPEFQIPTNNTPYRTGAPDKDPEEEEVKIEGILAAYFAKEEFTKETTEVDGQHVYTFASKNEKFDKNNIAGIIKKKVDAQVKANKKYAKLEDIKNALAEESYEEGTSITFNLYKLGANFIKINSAPLEEEVYVVAKTFLLDGKEVTIKIKEKEAIMVDPDADVTVVEAKENGAELTTLKATVENGIAKVKVKLRPKADEALATWKEKLAGNKKDGTHKYTVKNAFTVNRDLDAIAASIEKKSNTALAPNHIVKKEEIKSLLTEGASYTTSNSFEIPKYKKEKITEMLWLKAECQGDTIKHEEEFLKRDGQYFVVGKGKEIIFPLLVKPENDNGNKWGNSYNWSASQGNNMATFNTTRSGNRCGNWTRKHAARDLYTNPETEVVAICKGVVLEVKDFYSKTHQITILHETNDGRKFIVRYGELAPNSITVKKDDLIEQKQKLGVTGKLLNNDGSALLIRDGHIVYMLHFEIYSGNAGFDINIPLSNCEPPFARRNDLIDPLEILREGYVNTFNGNMENNGDRVNPSTLHFSQNGLNFLKGYEKEIKKDGKHVYFNDGYQFCTIGYGHLIAGKNSCESITIPDKFKDGLTDAEADALLFQDVQRISNLVKSKVTVDLYQYEFDALVSLAYNTEASVGSDSTLLRMLNTKNYDGAANEFKNWRVAAGVVSPGLVKRRAQETEIFKNNTYDSTH
ncbi:peptidoglycan DD-metalloendopeptidase family protein [Flavobacterium sp. ZT3R18]|uniref:glycoside hydrolase family protein n=1 Tax=Flavobacterium sp. ZT3R18 TaxID=2594429 RepID=UPI001179A435|nr:glycoside hydrolase family protein [Flavobacterium sp. ZT3R18]TRX36207.1 peptidoglycan DD-metalloendopeptidase family protein [Flavobacterium sp. ZT3R18]